jgi:hypothetical protein
MLTAPRSQVGGTMPRKEESVMDDDKLRDILRQWEAPDPNPELDARVRAAWRASRPRLWKRIWTARVSVPVPVLAVLLLIAAFLALKFAVVGAPAGGYAISRDATGFLPMPNGEARVITVTEAQ